MFPSLLGGSCAFGATYIGYDEDRCIRHRFSRELPFGARQ